MGFVIVVEDGLVLIEYVVIDFSLSFIIKL